MKTLTLKEKLIKSINESVDRQQTLSADLIAEDILSNIKELVLLDKLPVSDNLIDTLSNKAAEGIIKKKIYTSKTKLKNKFKKLLRSFESGLINKYNNYFAFRVKVDPDDEPVMVQFFCNLNGLKKFSKKYFNESNDDMLPTAVASMLMDNGCDYVHVFSVQKLNLLYNKHKDVNE